MNAPADLITLYLHGTLTAEQHQQLGEWIRADRDNARQFAAEVVVHHRLRERLRSDAQLQSIQLPSRPRSYPIRSRLAIAAGLLLAITLVFWWIRGDAAHATILAQLDAQWSVTGDLKAGVPVDLHAGRVQLQFASGATVLIQGPAQFKIAERSLNLLHGQIVVRCPTAESREITVHSGGASIIDHGTEFGVTTDASGRGIVHVIEGKIEARSATHATTLIAGQSATLATLKLADAPSEIADLRQLARTDIHSLTNRNARVRDWAAARQNHLTDPSLAFLAADRERGAIDWVTLAPLASSSATPRVAGRLGTKTAWSFTDPAHALRGALVAPFDEITFAAWVKLNEQDPAVLRHRGLLMSDGWRKPGQLHWQAKGRDFRLSYFDQGDSIDPRFAASPEGLLDGEWHLLVTTVRRLPRMEVTHYLDGKPAYRRTFDSAAPPLMLGSFSIGGWTAGPPDAPDRTLNGAMEDIMIWRRTLDANEVQTLFEESRP